MVALDATHPHCPQLPLHLVFKMLSNQVVFDNRYDRIFLASGIVGPVKPKRLRILCRNSGGCTSITRIIVRITTGHAGLPELLETKCPRHHDFEESSRARKFRNRH